MVKAWWKQSVVYQIYPRSFMDSNGDGIGDLRGIIGKLDYFERLGVDVVWLSPVYRSRNDDNGYDISDYQDINPQVRYPGGLGRARGRTACAQHQDRDGSRRRSQLGRTPVVSARASRQSPYRDWYIWRDGKDGRGPNNWASFFGGSAWQYNEPTGDYYLHLFSKKQPDPNWEAPALRHAVYAMMHWWVARGVDGFRMDVINALSKVPSFSDAPNPDRQRYVFAPQFFMQGPRIAEFHAEMKREVLSRYDLFTVGEAALTTMQGAAAMVDADHLPGRGTRNDQRGRDQFGRGLRLYAHQRGRQARGPRQFLRLDGDRRHAGRRGCGAVDRQSYSG